MNRGPWWVTVHMVAQSQTQLKQLSTHASANGSPHVSIFSQTFIFPLPVIFPDYQSHFMYPSHYYMSSLYNVLSKSVVSQFPPPKFYPVSCTLFISFFFFNEKIIALQNFCSFLSVIDKNQPQVYPCPLPLKPSSYLSPYPTLLDCYRAPVWIPWVMQQIPIGYLFYISAKIFRIVRESIPRQGSWGGDRGLEFWRRRKGQTYFSSTFLKII